MYISEHQQSNRLSMANKMYQYMCVYDITRLKTFQYTKMLLKLGTKSMQFCYVKLMFIYIEYFVLKS